REELVILIHPSILSNQRQLEGYQREYDAKSKVAPRARTSVEGGGVLPARDEYNPNVGKAIPVQPNAARDAMMTSPTHRAMRNKRRR
ncbi:MAG: hypothetical protein VCA34_17520, partial [Roseibacillus sp.]